MGQPGLLQSLKHLPRALRLPFTMAGVLPFLMGSALAPWPPLIDRLVLGAVAVACTHLSANLMNDYGDSRSRADRQDPEYYGFFGGSKLIQTGVLSERFYLVASVIFAVIAAGCVVALAIIMQHPWMVPLYVAVLILAWSYSERPLRLSYHALGEPVIFVLFGMAPVMAGYYLRTEIFPTMQAFLLSLPFGFLTVAILVSNEVPDCSTDQAAGKRNWVVAVGRERGYLIYLALVAAAFLSIIAAVWMGAVGLPALVALFLVPIPVKAARILRRCCVDKKEAVPSSKLTIALHALVGLVLIAMALLWPA